jgi:uncharacterized protein YbjT (DUF2867 family)
VKAVRVGSTGRLSPVDPLRARDGFVSRLAGRPRQPAFIPVMEPSDPVVPVSVHDVARVFAEALRCRITARRAFEVGGPDVLTLNEIYREIAAAGRKASQAARTSRRAGFWPAGSRAFRKGWLDEPPVTRDQLKSLARQRGGPLRHSRGLRRSVAAVPLRHPGISGAARAP